MVGRIGDYRGNGVTVPAFSRRSRFNSADSSVVVPGRCPPSTSACRTHLRNVSAVPIPSFWATAVIALSDAGLGQRG
jgi:hypothetical protein